MESFIFLCSKQTAVYFKSVFEMFEKKTETTDKLSSHSAVLLCQYSFVYRLLFCEMSQMQLVNEVVISNAPCFPISFISPSV